MDVAPVHIQNRRVSLSVFESADAGQRRFQEIIDNDDENELSGPSKVKFRSISFFT